MSRFARRIQRISAQRSIGPGGGPDGRVYTQAILSDMPAIYYALQETSGTIAFDWSGNSRDGTYHGGVELDYAWNPYQFPHVALGRQIHVDNVNLNTLYLQLPANSVNVTNGLSVELWVKPEDWNWNTHLFDFSDSSGTSDIGLSVSNSELSFSVGAGTITAPPLVYGTWYHIVATVTSAGSACIYQDGVLVASGLVAVPVQQNRPSLNFIKCIAGGNYLGGALTQIAVYEKVLSLAEVQNHHTVGLSDQDPVWHGTAEWYDTTYFNQFTNAGALLGNPNYVLTADWMPNTMYNAAEIATMKPYVDATINPPTNSDYQWYRDSAMYVLPSAGVGTMVGARGSETIGYFTDDEADMRGASGLATMQAAVSEVPVGFMGYANFGIFITMGMGDPALTRGQFMNMPGIEAESVDQYWYSMNTSTGAALEQYWGLSVSQTRRACNYGATMERARSTQDTARPLWNFIELAHPYSSNDQGGPNPDQVEGAAWASIIGGARGILWFHHNFGQVDGGGNVVVPDAWSVLTDYREGQCVSYGGNWYYAALKPAVGEVPNTSSYTWVRWDANSGASIADASGKHPDLHARLVKIKADLQTIAPAINSPTTPHLLHRNLYSTYRPQAHDAKKYIIAIPGLNAPNGGVFTMYVPVGQNPAVIEVVGEGRNITPFASGGRLKFTDAFASESSHHIYRW